MSRQHQPVVIESLGDIDAQTYVSASCRTCQHHAMVDISALVRKFGPGFPLDRVQKRLRCARCGVFDAEIRLGHRVSFRDPVGAGSPPDSGDRL
jgi:hypothetical protein